MKIIRSLRSLVCAAAIPLASVATANATDSSFQGGIQIGKHSDRWEVRAGGGSFDTGPFTSQRLSGGVINAEIVAPSPQFLEILGAPRPYLGTDISVSGTPVHVVYGGFNWEAHLTQRFYLGFSAGGSWNSSTLTVGGGGTKNLGSSLLFHLQASAGFDFTSNLTGQVFLNHFSNAGIKAPNHGLESVGARLGYRF
ncbi:MAG: acyloxyacyl hydrolase [Rhizobiaceae bacterium]